MTRAAQKPQSSLVPAHDGQRTVFKAAFEVLRQGIAESAFPGAATAITHKGKLVSLEGFGRFMYQPDSPQVKAETIFDLASVSKAIATTTMAMLLYERGELDLEAPVASVVPEFGHLNGRGEVTLHMLLAHSSGLPGYERLFEKAHNREELVRAAMQTPLTAKPGERVEYSDIGFIVLGEFLVQIANEPLAVFCQREIFGPLGMANTCFNPAAGLKPQIPPTENDRTFRRRIIQGEVQDENASVMGGVAGHAGVFAPAGDVALFAHALVSGGSPILSPESIALFTRRESSPAGTSRALGWDTPSQPSQSGKYFSPRSYGHLGYAGTSLWIDPEKQLAVTLLTNRTWPDRSNQKIKEVRPRFHDAVVEALGLV